MIDYSDLGGWMDGWIYSILPSARTPSPQLVLSGGLRGAVKIDIFLESKQILVFGKFY